MARFIVMAAVFLLTAMPLSAHPPTKIELNYDVAAQVLSINVDHVSSNFNKHYIRLLQIAKNRDNPVNITLPKQTSPEGLQKSIPMAADPGDTISVKVYSTEGGIGEESVVVSEPAEGRPGE